MYPNVIFVYNLFMSITLSVTSFLLSFFALYSVISIDDIGAWYYKTFHELLPLRVLTHPEEERELIDDSYDVPGCVMDSPNETMAIKLIDFDVQKNVNVLIDNSRVEAGYRQKRVCGIVHGSGGGKTRALEEMRRILLLKKVYWLLLLHIITFGLLMVMISRVTMTRGMDGETNMQTLLRHLMVLSLLVPLLGRLTLSL